MLHCVGQIALGSVFQVGEVVSSCYLFLLYGCLQVFHSLPLDLIHQSR